MDLCCLYSPLLITVAFLLFVWSVFVRRWKAGMWNKNVVTRYGKPSLEYNLVPMNGRSFYGLRARIAVRILTSFLGNMIVQPFLMRIYRGDVFRGVSLEERPTFYPLVKTTKQLALDSKEKLDIWDFVKPSSKESKEFAFLTISDLLDKYRTGKVTPLDVARAAIAAINVQNEKVEMNIFVEYNEKEALKAAKESTERYNNNAPLSVFDGIPVSAKDSFKVFGFTSHNGTSFINVTPAREEDEATIVNKLRKGGAILLGITNMHPLGIGTFGYNPSWRHGTNRNPYNVNHMPGGSSSGSASSVAAGINLVSLGTDGGGSIRIPASACGVVGVKATFGRISSAGLIMPQSSVGHAGPLAATVRDAALAYAFLAGPDEKCSPSMNQPVVSLKDFENLDLTGIRLGIDWRYFKDCMADVMDPCLSAVKYLERECNATIVEIFIPELMETEKAHLLTIMSEFLTDGQDIFYHHLHELDCSTAIPLAIATQITNVDFLSAQKQRTRAMNSLKDIFADVDCIITPGMPLTAPKLMPEAFSTGLSDVKLLNMMIRYMFLGNLAGIPGMTLPVGYGRNGLPIGLQIYASWYEEDVMLRVGHAAEGFRKERKKPDVFFSLV